MTASRTCDMLSHQYRSEGVAIGGGVPETTLLEMILHQHIQMKFEKLLHNYLLRYVCIYVYTTATGI